MKFKILLPPFKMLAPITENKNFFSKDLLINNNFPDRIAVQVKALKDVYALLYSPERGDFWAKVDSPVKVGEFLLLKFKNIQDGKPRYKIIKRCFGQFNVNEGENISLICLFIGGQEAFIPVIFRNLYCFEKGKDGGDQKTKGLPQDWELDFLVKTGNIGLIILRFKKKDNFYYSQILVETEKIGLFIERRLEEFCNISEELKKRGIILLKWGLIQAPLKEKISNLLRETGLRLDTQA